MGFGEISGFGTGDNGEIRPVGVVGLRDLGRGSKQRFRTIRGVFPQKFRLRRLFHFPLCVRLFEEGDRTDVADVLEWIGRSDCLQFEKLCLQSSRVHFERDPTMIELLHQVLNPL